MTITSLSDLKALKARLDQSASDKVKILMSLGTCGLAAGGSKVVDAIEETMASQNLGDKYEAVPVGCMGLCYCEPTIELRDNSGKSIIYGDVTAEQIPAILKAGMSGAPAGTTVVERTWYYPEDEANTHKALQARIALRNTGCINPELIEDYIRQDGYQALGKVLSGMKPAEVSQLVLEANLRGRGGAGFPTGKKWQFAAAQPKGKKYMICNADEGDPGAFMDRAVLEGDPHSVLEAMTIGGYAIGSDIGIIYIRAEYPLAITRLRIAIDQAHEMGFLGKNILNSGFDFDIELKYGAGAFVCGEETALIHSVEGRRGEPTFKPPFPAVQGLWKHPTVVNNVETYANVAAIIRKGAAWFRTVGTAGSPGTKVFALAGKVNHVGLVEVPMGTTLRDIIFSLGGGISKGRAFKAVQTGGPSGGCITTKNLDTPIDYETLKAIGSMMGSGGMIVMDEDDCMVNIARFFLEFTCDESCGKCTPCRIGNRRLYEMLTDICHGKGTPQTLVELRNLALVIKDTALCGLGQTSPNPVLSTLTNFADEYEAHVNEKRCPAGVCERLVRFTINEKCVGCGVCARNCPVTAITGATKKRHVINQDKCIKCGICFEKCMFKAIDKQ
ncbi:NADH:ubiquinone oxidoreductase subunit F (NADH-binding)/Pyruvate/2-oxoacid:ferredoxin oxidoreductase delta subunit/(2Fe-2S) ferredoxin [Oligosphaera ethanolica]|uniref:NADH:ubiquinone oxidoreductase subunit F (NADH-binding)/Pyruvate/2-oxoacid:ferredoxin oxidoreductase delta subunit/(2Fe-2S) ferredoxin n=2 Tax=Oligosphaera ethanolica TaxID=760260 RepID=A0AAE3VK33_9BACT|nr:NADH:ubiquinone oxidoreductase subunit F (NADH-binding)/Pyruvate/2-oxoacid:ferredoxin oxidoreductase delta subunit/(2Fe-2S) ferredoxin [Oligosphaera ethanolica]